MIYFNILHTVLHQLMPLFKCIASLVFAEMSAASSLIAMGVVIGKTNPVHLLLMSLMEVTGLILNNWLIYTLVKVNHLPGCEHNFRCSV